MKNYDRIGCRVQLNPNGNDLRCGDKLNNINWNQNEGVVQLCEICRLKKQNSTMLEMLNRRYPSGPKDAYSGFPVRQDNPATANQNGEQ